MTKGKSVYNSQFWDKVARFYTIIQEGMNKRVYQQTYSILRPMLHRSDTVFEMAAGTGQFASVLACNVEQWIASDFSIKMVEQLSHRLKDQSNVSVRQEDATSVLMECNTADVVVIANALHVIPNPHLALREANRILKNEGLLLAPTFLRREKDSLLMKFYKLIGFKTFETFNEDELAMLVSDNGFKIEQIQTIKGKFLHECVLIARKA